MNKIQYVDLNCDADHMKESEIFLNFFTLRVPLARFKIETILTPILFRAGEPKIHDKVIDKL